MEKIRGEIHLGDFAQALASLPWQNDDQAQAIAACLGFGLAPSLPPKPNEGIYDRHSYSQPTPYKPKLPTSPPVFIPPVLEPPPTLPPTKLESQVDSWQTLAPPIEKSPDWLGEKHESVQTINETKIARLSLFPEQTHRHILAAALATRRMGHDIDLPKLMAALCRREVLTQLPCRPEASLERGCDLLLDYSPSMVPFWEDLNGLIEQVGRVVGAANVRVFGFDTRPTEAKRWTGDGKLQGWQVQKRPVLVATDFGISGLQCRAESDPAWHELIADCTKDGSPLVILIPWPEDRWPKGLGGYPKLAHWSPRTTAAMVKRQIGPGHWMR
ncbi:MAG: hypothetical protein ACOYMG_26205 [Candidatus Methylumidiphilus sp.]